MGSFNVACSISNLSIGPGTPTVFIPLVPNNYADRLSKDDENYYQDLKDYFGKEYFDMEPWEIKHRVGVQSTLIYSNCYFNPFSLPIKGVYNDYGNLENIKKDANTKAIEKFFGITIDQFMNCVTTSRNWTCYLSGESEAFFEKSRLLSNYDAKFDGKFLKAFGFKKGKDGLYLYKKFPYKVKPTIIDKKEGYKIYDKSGKEVKSDNEVYDTKQKFLQTFEKLTNWKLGVAPKNQKRVNIISNLSGMFVIEEIYDSFKGSSNWGTVACRSLTEDVLNDLGFKAQRKKEKRFNNTSISVFKKSNQRTYVLLDDLGSDIVWLEKKKKKNVTVYSVNDFQKQWEEITGENLNIEKYKKIYQNDIEFKKLREELIKYEKKRKTKVYKANQKKRKKFYKELRWSIKRLNAFDDPLGDSLLCFKEWKFFTDLYRKPIMKGELVEEFRWFRLFQSSMYSNNRFFFPAMNGEQCGNDEESKTLLETSLKIVDRRLKEQKEWEKELER